MQSLATADKHKSAYSPSTVGPIHEGAMEDQSFWVLDSGPTTVALAARERAYSSASSPSTVTVRTVLTALSAIATSIHERSKILSERRERQLAAVRQLYELPNASALLQFFPDDELMSALQAAADLIARTFELKARAILRAVADGDAGKFVELQIVVPVRLSVEDASDRLESFDATWWMNLPDSVRRIVTVDVAFT